MESIKESDEFQSVSVWFSTQVLCHTKTMVTSLPQAPLDHKFSYMFITRPTGMGIWPFLSESAEVFAGVEGHDRLGLPLAVSLSWFMRKRVLMNLYFKVWETHLHYCNYIPPWSSPDCLILLTKSLPSTSIAIAASTTKRELGKWRQTSHSTRKFELVIFERQRKG